MKRTVQMAKQLPPTTRLTMSRMGYGRNLGLAPFSEDTRLPRSVRRSRKTMTLWPKFPYPLLNALLQRI